MWCSKIFLGVSYSHFTIYIFRMFFSHINNKRGVDRREKTRVRERRNVIHLILPFYYYHYARFVGIFYVIDCVQVCVCVWFILQLYDIIYYIYLSRCLGLSFTIELNEIPLMLLLLLLRTKQHFTIFVANTFLPKKGRFDTHPDLATIYDFPI